MDKTERYLKSIDNSLKVIAKALSDKDTVTKDTPVVKRKPPDAYKGNDLIEFYRMIDKSQS